MKRRDFIKTAAIASGAAFLPHTIHAQEQKPQNALPRWRGFNLLEKFTFNRNAPYKEQDFEWMADWKFDFVRLPMDYRCWTNPEKPYEYNEDVLKHIDQVVDWGRQYNIHINLNLHRAPGYCVNPPKEELDLWISEEAQKQFTSQWRMFAERYKNEPQELVSFDMVNEPGKIDEQAYVKVMRMAIDAIRKVNSDRRIVIDGLEWGRKPVQALAEIGIGQSTRGYDPMYISHYKASWTPGQEGKGEPTWPLKINGNEWDKQRLYQEKIVPFQPVQQSAGVHVGECGCYNKTPHNVMLAWMEDCLSLWQENNWGWAIWNLRGSFGIVDSDRPDVQYEDFKGHKLDRKYLELLQKY